MEFLDPLSDEGGDGGRLVDEGVVAGFVQFNVFDLGDLFAHANHIPVQGYVLN